MDRKGSFRLNGENGIVRGAVEDDPHGPPLAGLVENLSRPGVDVVHVIAFSVRPARD